LTRDEIQVVERLQEMGFSRRQVMEAFIVSNRNEQMAANYLFENAADFSSAHVIPMVRNISRLPQSASGASDSLSIQLSVPAQTDTVSDEVRSDEAQDNGNSHEEDRNTNTDNQ